MAETYKLSRKLLAARQKAIEAIRVEMEAAATQVVAEMKALVPVDTGALRDSIGWSWGEAPKGSMTVSTIKGRRSEGLFISIYAGTRDKQLGDQDAFYARWQEFGTKTMPPNPFFYTVWRANRHHVRSRINRAVRKAVKST